MGRNHVRAYSVLQEAIPCCRRPRVRGTRRFSARAGRLNVTELDKLLPLVDAVSIMVPTELELAVATRCLRRGVHVLLEIAATIRRGGTDHP